MLNSKRGSSKSHLTGGLDSSSTSSSEDDVSDFDERILSKWELNYIDQEV